MTGRRAGRCFHDRGVWSAWRGWRGRPEERFLRDEIDALESELEETRRRLEKIAASKRDQTPPQATAERDESQ